MSGSSAVSAISELNRSNRRLMMMTADDLAAAVGAEAVNELASALGKIKHCLGQLTDEQSRWWQTDRNPAPGRTAEATP
jgi:hypothetical protein